MKPRVFVVMPFRRKQARAEIPASGDKPAQPARFVDFDEVYRELIRPALVKAGCEPFRADEEAAAGDIRTDMYFELVTADVVVADISILNPNVFYELGIRHGVSPRGVIQIHGDWERQPFDVAPDRTFGYKGEIWEVSVPRDDTWKFTVQAEIDKLTGTLQDAIAADAKTIASPVYSELPGLKPVDWRQIETARAKYFKGILDDWKDRLLVSQKQGWPGDILTLAGDAPTRWHQEKLLSAAAKALIDLCRFDAAERILRDVLAVAPDLLDAQCQRGLVLNRLGKTAEAEVLLQKVAEEHREEPEALGILGRVYKDMWRTRWESLPDLNARQKQALFSSQLAVVAAQSYALALRAHPESYYNAINLLSLAKLLEHLRTASAGNSIAPYLKNIDDVPSLVRFAATVALEAAEPRNNEKSNEEKTWAHATLGELSILTGDSAAAQEHYRIAATTPDVTHFQVDSMLSQLLLFQKLGYRLEIVNPVVAILQESLTFLPPKPPEFNKVAVFSGHMIDLPGRPELRFPGTPEKVDAVRNRLAACLDKWGVGKGDLAMCGGARGGDILFAELCQERGAHVRLLIPKDEGTFLMESVQLPNTSEWEDRFKALRKSCEIWFQPDRLGLPPEGTSAFERNNLWILNTARAEAKELQLLHAALVWDGKPQGDGPGGTSHFAEQVKKSGGQLCLINPLSTSLVPGARVVKITISQFFQMADLLTYPDKVKSDAERFIKVIRASKALDRAINRPKKKEWKIQIGNLGALSPVSADSFWGDSIQSLGRPEAPPLFFFPFELPLSDQLKKLDLAPSSVLKMTLRESVENPQITGRLRIYPPGTGVVHVAVTLTFREAVDLDVVNQIAQHVEDLLFVDTHGEATPPDKFFQNVIDQVNHSLFKELQRFPWEPRHTVYSLAGDIDPAPCVTELAQLMSVAPGQKRPVGALESRLRDALGSSSWKTESTLALAGQNVALLLGGRSSKDLNPLAETHELVSAAVYAVKAFIRDLGLIPSPLETSWLPGQANFDYMKRLFETMVEVLRAISSLRFLTDHRVGRVNTFAEDVWTYSIPVRYSVLQERIEEVERWYKDRTTPESTKEIEDLRESIRRVKAFLSKPPLFPFPEDRDPEQEPEPSRKVRLFFSYAQKDEDLRRGLGEHLKGLLGSGLVERWDDRNIPSGSSWGEQISEKLEQADVVLFLVSPPFMKSGYSQAAEVKRAVELHEAGKLRVIPVIVRPADWAPAPFAKLQALPDGGKPVIEWRPREEGFKNVAMGIRRTVQQMLAS